MQLIEATPVLPTDKDRSTIASRSTELRYELSTPWYAQRRAFRLIVLLLILNIIAVTSITWGPLTARAWQDWRAARQAAAAQEAAAAAQSQAAAAKAAAHNADVAARRAAFQQCLSFNLPAGQVVFTEDSAEAARLLGDTTARYSAVGFLQNPSSTIMPHPPVILSGTTELRRLLSLPVISRNADGAIFLHERRTPGGLPRMVWVAVVVSRELTRTHERNVGYLEVQTARRLEAQVYDPAANDGVGKLLWHYTLEIPQHREQRLRVLESSEPSDSRKPNLTDMPGYVMRRGEVLRILRAPLDTSDPTRIAIDYTLDGKAGTLELRLGDDDRLRAAVDRGSKTIHAFSEYSGTEAWEPRQERK